MNIKTRVVIENFKVKNVDTLQLEKVNEFVEKYSTIKHLIECLHYLKNYLIKVYIIRRKECIFENPVQNFEITIEIYKEKKLYLKDFLNNIQFFRKYTTGNEFIDKAIKYTIEVVSKYLTCFRCGDCCFTGTPLITLEDALILFRDSYVKNVIENLLSIKFHNVYEFFLYWNLNYDKLRPCPFIEVKKCYTVCRIYQIRPTICRIFKCWDINVEFERLNVLNNILNDLNSIYIPDMVDEIDRVRNIIKSMIDTVKQLL